MGWKPVLMFLALLLAGCAHRTPDVTAPKASVQMPAMPESAKGASQQASPALRASEEDAPLPRWAPSHSAFLAGLSEHEIEAIRALAVRIYAPRWPVIAQRARFVLEVVWQTIDAMQAPRELAWIPVVESGYEPYALSPSGALGLWQLMPQTARHLGLRASAAIDPRRAIASSTEAAVRYLLALRDRFGNWPLAIAAYHMGPGALARALSQTPWHPEDGLAALPVPEVTRNYVQCVLGLIAAAEEDLFAFPKPIATDTILVSPPVDLIAWANAAGTDAMILFRLNPGLEHAEILHRAVALRVPKESAARWKRALLQARPKTAKLPVRRGDTLWSIARRLGVPVRVLVALNPGIRPERLHPGARIRVPVKRFALVRLHPRPNPLLSRGRRVRYVVRPGDTLWRIARRFGTTPEKIARLNARRTDALLRPGEVLWVIAHPSSG